MIQVELLFCMFQKSARLAGSGLTIEAQTADWQFERLTYEP